MHSVNTKNDEKKFVAGTSVLAAVFLTATKIVVGLATNSLGILAEAAHSGLDLVASVLTYVAVRISGKPADPEHNYGHGKIENLSAFIETLLLVLTCFWIVWEAIERLLFKKAEIEVNVWAFLVIIVSIVIDVSRSRALYKTAKKFNSQALEADALHFSTDVWSSAVVLLGLVFVKAHQYLPQWGFLREADAFAALVVAGIVVIVCGRLGIRTINALLDTAPAGMEQKIIKVVESLPGITDCHRLRMRYSGSTLFVDAHVRMDKNLTLATAHELMDKIEAAIKTIAPEVDVTVHPEPIR